MICIQIHSSRATADIQPRAGTLTPFYCARAHERSRDRDATRESESAHTHATAHAHDGTTAHGLARHSDTAPKVPIPQQLHRLQTPIMALQRGPRERERGIPHSLPPAYPSPPTSVRYDITA
jgi:hypothetical protein